MRVFIPVILGLLAATPVSAQETPRNLVRVEVGAGEFHRSTGVHVGARLARTWIGDYLRLDVGVLIGSGDEGFFAVDAGPEVRLCPSRCRVAPFLGAALGALREPHFGVGGISRAGGGVEVTLRANHLFRVGVYRGRHGAGHCRRAEGRI